MLIQFITLFPETLTPYLGASMMWKANRDNIATYEVIDLRGFGKGPRRTVDDTPYGGGDGMLLMVEPIVKAIEMAKEKSPDALVIIPTPRGKTYRQSDAKQLAADGRDLIFICPRYEGYDERVINWVDLQYSVGNYVLTGGELPALTIADSIVRLLPGVLGGAESVAKESFQLDDHNIEHAQYTRPAEFRGLSVPEVLQKGHHAEIEKWRSEVL
jgi:tRNA (guanine37-N1)-methyltransferase